MTTIGYEQQLRLCERLGVDPNRVARITVTFEPQQLATIDVRMFADEGDLDLVVEGSAFSHSHMQIER